MTVPLGVLDDRGCWISLYDVGLVFDTEGLQCLAGILDDTFAFFDERVDHRVFDDSDAVACRIRDEQEADRCVCPVREFPNVV